MQRALLAAALLALACGTKPPPPPEDAGALVDAGGDAGADGGVDAGADAGRDAGVDGGTDAGADAGFDAGAQDAGCRDPDAGASPNLLLNPGFECGTPISDWLPSLSASLFEETSNPHAGLRAAKLVADDGGVRIALSPTLEPVAQNPGIRIFCASAWVRGLDGGNPADVTLMFLTNQGGLFEYAASAPARAGWQRVDVNARADGTIDRVTLRVAINVPARGEPLWVDDVQLWTSADAGCHER